MAQELEFDPVESLAVGTVGPSGQRAFYIQATDAYKTLTMLVEKVQVQAIAERTMTLLKDEKPGKAEKPAQLVEPVNPDWRAGELGIGMDRERSQVVLIAREAAEEEDTPEEELSSVRMWIRPELMRAVATRGLELVTAGRPLCPVCGLPMDPEGHLCPRRNGKSPVF